MYFVAILCTLVYRKPANMNVKKLEIGRRESADGCASASAYTPNTAATACYYLTWPPFVPVLREAA